MAEQQNRQPELRRQAAEISRRLSPEEREALLIKCWMSHDARWFAAVASAFGMEAANRLNQIAAHEEGKVEARRIVRALQLPPVTTPDEFLLVQEIMINLLGPDLLEYEVVWTGESAYQLVVRRCFAHENVTRAGVDQQYECGIFARVTGWLEALGLEYEMTPALGRCMKSQGRECMYSFNFEGASRSPAPES